MTDDASHCLQRWGEVMLGPYLTWLMPVFVIVSTFGSANGCLFASGRCVWLVVVVNVFISPFASGSCPC